MNRHPAPRFIAADVRYDVGSDSWRAEARWYHDTTGEPINALGFVVAYADGPSAAALKAHTQLAGQS